VISAGNDIIALKAVDIQRTQSPAFYSKFIIPAEFALYHPDEIALANFVWLLWSAKESAYKYLKRISPELIFAPAKLVVQQLNIPRPSKVAENTGYYQGKLSAGSTTLSFLSTMSHEYIATIIDQSDVHWRVREIEASDYESQSKAVRDFLLDDLKMPDITVGKHPSGYPVLIKDGKELDIAVSFAHHDRYISYCYQILK
jgi:phosphopantetheinyl transferase (holo-ACP synthase)